ncbi:BREX-1 system adenine-specific DNA-methyltransferase PglX, partial [Lacticaseibacillus saniviri]|uniref:BREX-1 system adenine-specific DNA-methyltransferase PglX n=1 Tax=Lacticaseibacillus saniviri TaxID=931533 RepID=UPI001EDE96C7
LTMIDPSMGSGHILIYAFDVLQRIYTDEGYSQREAARLILAHNLFGADIDKRAFQLAYFAMMMKGRQYDRRILRSDVAPHVFDVPSVHWTNADLELLTTDPDTLQSLKTVSSLFGKGNELGSLINVDPKQTSLKSLRDIVRNNDSSGQLSLQSAHVSELCGELDTVLNVLDLLTDHYQIGITNPPYMGSGKMPSKLSAFVKKHYPNSKSDLFAVFMERLRELTIDDGYYAMITQHQWMFLSSFEALRKQLSQQTFINLAHLGTHVFEEIGGEVVQSVAFVMQKAHTSGYIGTYERLVDLESQSKKEQAYLEAVKEPNLSYVYRANQTMFTEISESPIAYWFPKKTFQLFKGLPPLESIVELKAGLSTGDNDLFQRRWQEVSVENISFHTTDISETVSSSSRWYPCRTGGEFIRWYSRNEMVVDWQGNGQRIRHHRNSKQNIAGAARNTEYYFKPGITWTKLSSSKFGVKFAPDGYIFDDTSRTMFPKKGISVQLVLGILNSKVAFNILQGLNPSMSFTNGDLKRIPIPTQSTAMINQLVDSSIVAVETYINTQETSWLFRQFQIFPIAEHTLALLRKLADIQAHVPKMCQRIIIPFKGVNQLSW